MPEIASPRYSIVLPCYNEAGTLPMLFSRFGAVIKQRTDIEVIFVDNGSKDDSASVLIKELEAPSRSWARSIRVETNQGYGFGILTGLREARGNFIGWTHADSQYDPAVVLEGFQLLENASDSARCFVQGRRIDRNLFDAFFTAGMSMIASLALSASFKDINAQPKLFSRPFLEHMQNPPKDFSLDLYVLFLALRQGYRILYLPVHFNRRLHGQAKGGGSLPLKWKLTKRTWAFILKLRRDIHAGRV